MNTLSSISLEVREGHGAPGEVRRELRTIDTDIFVAWFRSQRRISAGEIIVTTSMQLIRRDDLSDEQRQYARKWLQEESFAAMDI